MMLRKRAVIFTALWITVMVIIFLFSNDDAEASSAKSEAVVVIVETVEEVLDLTPTQEIRAMTEMIVRKCAHVFLYTCLGITGTLAVREYVRAIFAKTLWKRRKNENRSPTGRAEAANRGKGKSEKSYVGSGKAVETATGKFRAATALATYVLCFLYACTDEWHQTFRSGRSGSFRDVMIDSIGMVLGIGITTLILIIPDRFYAKNHRGED